MGCPSPEHLSAYLAGLLPPNDLATVQAHLEGCLVCEARLSDLQSRSGSPVRHSHVAGQSDPQERVTAGKTIHPAVANVDVARALLGPYELLEKLGQGGMGAVYKARHRKLDRIEAVKILPRQLMQHAQAVERFEREMRAVAKLDHPHIVRAHHAGEENGQHYLVMEHVDGCDVGLLIKQRTQLSINDACEIVRQAAEGLQHAHESGLVHRDIKPSNLIVSRKGVVKILDLGLALVGAESGLQAGELTSTGQIMGTLDYMAPEQGGDSHQVDIRADLYSLGATLYHMLAGRAPFGGGKHGNVIQKLKALANEEPRPIAELRPEIPAELAAIVHRLLSKQPQDRFATPAEVAAEMQRFAVGHDLRKLVGAPLSFPTDGPVMPSASTFDYSASPVGATEPTLLGRTPQLGESREWSAPADSRVARAPSKPPQRTIRTRLLAIVGTLGCVMLGAVVLRLSTDRGILVITSPDPGVKIAIKKSGRTVKELELAQGDNKVAVWSGDYEVELSGQFDGLTVKDGEFLLTRGDTRPVHIERMAPTAVAVTPRDSAKLNPPEFSERVFQGDRAGEERDDNGLKMKFCWCPDGGFLMGVRKGDMLQDPIGDPVRVDLSGFWLGKHEVTQRDWGQVMSTTPWSGKAGVREGENYPATHVSWIDADEFCRKLTQQEQQSGRLRSNEKYALPTEAQWEYGCRAGSSAAFTFGDDPKRLGEYAWYRDTAGDEVTGYAHPVGLKLANAWGLHDMHGNVWEWCADWFRSKLSGGRNPEVTRREELSLRQVRGGCFWNYHQNCISGWRAGSDPVDAQNNKGFRVARVLSLQPLIVPFDDVTAKASQQAWANSLGEPSSVKQNSIGLELALIPPGNFLMGSPVTERDRNVDENQVEVTLTSPFWLGTCEVTRVEWERVMGKNFSPGVPDSERQWAVERSPMTYISWLGTVEFCKKLTARERQAGHLSNDWEYALPTEAQWEYACRAGTNSPFSCGDDEKLLPEFAWMARTGNEGHVRPVRGLRPNAFGLYDMQGNVSEFCRDAYTVRLPGGIDPVVPVGPNTIECVTRGSSWSHFSRGCRSATRSKLGTDTFGLWLGFRVALVRTPQSPAVGFTSPIPARIVQPTIPEKATPVIGAISVARPLSRPAPVALDLKPLPVELPPNSPLSPSALVARPQAIPGVLSWTIELRRPRLSERDLQFSPDGAYFATGGDDRVLRIWSRLDGRMVKAFVGATVDGNSSISAVSWSACGRFIAATHFQEGVHIWEISTGHCVAWIKAPVRTAKWSPDNRYLALAIPGKVQLWDAIEQRVTKEPQTDSSLGTASAVAWSPTGRHLATACKGGIGVFDVETDTMTIGPDHAIPTVTAVEWSPDGRLIAACDNQDKGYIVDAAGQRVLDSFSVRAYSADMHWSPDGQSLCLPNSDIRDMVSGTTQKAPGWRISPASVRAWSPDGNAIYETNQNGMTSKLDLKTRKMEILADLNHMIDDLSWSPDGTMVGVHHGRAGAGPILAWRSEGGKLVESPKGAIGEFCWAPPGRRVAVSNDNLATKEAIEVWNLETQQMDITLKPPNTSSIYLAVSSDGRRMAAIDADRVLRIWDLEKRALEREVPLQGKLPGFCTFQFSPDAKWLALGGDSSPDSSLWIWNTTDWSVIQKSWKTGVAQHLVWSPDSSALSIASRIITLPLGQEQPSPKESGRLHVWTRGGLRVYEDEERWTIDDGVKKQSFNSKPDGIDPTDFCVSPDERYLVTGGVNGFAWIWDLQTCERAVGFILIPEQQRPLAISPKGHYRSDADVSDAIVYVVQTAAGQQTLTPSEFATRFGWKNDPSQVVIPKASAAVRPRS